MAQGKDWSSRFSYLTWTHVELLPSEYYFVISSHFTLLCNISIWLGIEKCHKGNNNRHTDRKTFIGGFNQSTSSLPVLRLNKTCGLLVRLNVTLVFCNGPWDLLHSLAWYQALITGPAVQSSDRLLHISRCPWASDEIWAFEKLRLSAAVQDVLH